MMADGENNHKRKELDTKLDANTMDNVEYQKEKLKIVHQRSFIHCHDPFWAHKILSNIDTEKAKAAEILLSELKKCVHQRRESMLRQLGVFSYA